MRIEEAAARVLLDRIGDQAHPVRFLVEGGSIHGIHVRVFPSSEPLPGDKQGRVGDLDWVVDPVSWQYLSNTTVEWDPGLSQLILLGVPEVGPGPGSKKIVLQVGG